MTFIADAFLNLRKMQLYKKRKILSSFFLHFLNLDSILIFFEKKMTLIADVFWNLQTRNDVIREMSKKSPFRGPLDK